MSASPTLSSTRFKIICIAVLIAVGRELAAQFGIEISAEAFYGIEAMLLSLAGLDTVRPLGMGKPAAPAADPAPAAEEVAEVVEEGAGD